MRLYHHLREGVFLRRPNRFIAHCLVDGAETVCHVKNTGRCRELLVPCARVWLEESDNPARKTRFDLVAVENRGYVVNMDSQAPNRVFARWAEEGGYLPGLTGLSAETVYGASRFDFSYRRVGRKGFVVIWNLNCSVLLNIHTMKPNIKNGIIIIQIAKRAFLNNILKLTYVIPSSTILGISV